jgi:hypothetical protein
MIRCESKRFIGKVTYELHQTVRPITKAYQMHNLQQKQNENKQENIHAAKPKSGGTRTITPYITSWQTQKSHVDTSINIQTRCHLVCHGKVAVHLPAFLRSVCIGNIAARSLTEQFRNHCNQSQCMFLINLGHILTEQQKNQQRMGDIAIAYNLQEFSAVPPNNSQMRHV